MPNPKPHTPPTCSRWMSDAAAAAVLVSASRLSTSPPSLSSLSRGVTSSTSLMDWASRGLASCGHRGDTHGAAMSP